MKDNCVLIEGCFSQYLRRVYKMNYVPSGFWSRLIARLMIAVQRWGAEEGLKDGLICADDGKDVRSSTHFRPVPQGYSMIYWREGLGVVYEGGHLMVESYSEMVSFILSCFGRLSFVIHFQLKNSSKIVNHGIINEQWSYFIYV